ncbi:hypothetical protein EDC01DRAFT_783729 [Geopyxis carbonaria]|nr:hypothetical protein EDC01DRAFT_783729 [Geopyxis carbonaria]
MPRKRSKKNKNNPLPKPVWPRPSALPNPAAFDLPQAQHAAAANVRSVAPPPAPPPALPRAPPGASMPTNLAWTHNNGAGMRGWGRTKTASKTNQNGPDSARPVATSSAFGRPPLVQRWQGRRLALFCCGESRSAPVPDFFEKDETMLPEAEVAAKGYWDDTGAFVEKETGGGSVEAVEDQEEEYESEW